MTTVYIVEKTVYELCDSYYPQDFQITLGVFTTEGNAMRFMGEVVRQDAWRRNERGNYAYGLIPDSDNDNHAKHYNKFKPTYEIRPFELDWKVYKP